VYRPVSAAPRDTLAAEPGERLRSRCGTLGSGGLLAPLAQARATPSPNQVQVLHGWAHHTRLARQGCWVLLALPARPSVPPPAVQCLAAHVDLAGALAGLLAVALGGCVLAAARARAGGADVSAAGAHAASAARHGAAPLLLQAWCHHARRPPPSPDELHAAGQGSGGLVATELQAMRRRGRGRWGRWAARRMQRKRGPVLPGCLQAQLLPNRQRPHARKRPGASAPCPPAHQVVGEGAGAVGHGAGALQVGGAGEQALLVVHGLVGLGLGQQVRGLAGRGGGGLGLAPGARRLPPVVACGARLLLPGCSWGAAGATLPLLRAAMLGRAACNRGQRPGRQRQSEEWATGPRAESGACAGCCVTPAAPLGGVRPLTRSAWAAGASSVLRATTAPATATFSLGWAEARTDTWRRLVPARMLQGQGGGGGCGAAVAAPPGTAISTVPCHHAPVAA